MNDTMVLVRKVAELGSSRVLRDGGPQLPMGGTRPAIVFKSLADHGVSGGGLHIRCPTYSVPCYLSPHMSFLPCSIRHAGMGWRYR